MGPDALACTEHQHLDLAILDVMLPDMDGFALCQKIREKHLFPILMLTAKVEDMDKITGLTLGADDYITKPFNPLELVARVKTQLRRYTRYNPAGAAAEPRAGVRHPGVADLQGHPQVPLVRGGAGPDPAGVLHPVVSVRAIRARWCSSEELFEAVWGEKYLDCNNTVMSHIARLREKMHENSRRPKFIKTVWGVGYTIE